MPTDKGELLDAMIKAYAMEKGTRKFYERAAEAAYEEAARLGFAELARREGEHMDYIRHLYQAITAGRELMSIGEFRKAGPGAPEGFPPPPETGEWIEEYSFVNELGAIMEALKMEAGSYAFYDDILKKTKEPATRALIEGLKDLEEGHIKYLKDLRMKLDETP